VDPRRVLHVLQIGLILSRFSAFGSSGPRPGYNTLGAAKAGKDHEERKLSISIII
jgi:hypothetical protein